AVTPHDAFLQLEGDGRQVFGQLAILNRGYFGGEAREDRAVRHVVEQWFLHQLTGQEVLRAGTGVGVGGRRSLPLDEAELAALTAGAAFHAGIEAARSALNWAGGRRAVLARVHRETVLSTTSNGGVRHEQRHAGADARCA